MSDLETRDFLPNLDTLEIGSLGHFEKEALTTLHTNNLIPLTCTNQYTAPLTSYGVSRQLPLREYRCKQFIVQLLWILHRVKVVTFGCSGVCFMLVAVVVPGKVTGGSSYRKMKRSKSF